MNSGIDFALFRKKKSHGAGIKILAPGMRTTGTRDSVMGLETAIA